MRNLEAYACSAKGAPDCSSKLIEDIRLQGVQPHVSKAPKQEWTIAIDLAINLNDTPSHGHLGAEQKSAWLKSLAADTKDKPVTLVVQARIEGAPNQPNGSLERYVVHGGEWHPLPAPSDPSLSKSLGDLVYTAGSKYPSNKLGLFVFSHGLAYDGIATDNKTKVPMNEVSDSLTRALLPLGAKKLDAVAYDACLMGEADVLSISNQFAKHVVASPELLPCQDEEACGLNLNGSINKLLANPQMNGQQLADAMVEVTRADALKLKTSNSASFVGSYTLGAKLDTFQSALNKFGSDLAASIDLAPHNRDSLQKLADETQSYDRALFNTLDIEPRDLVDFARRVKTAATIGSVQDITSILRRDADAVLSSYKALLSNSYAAPYYDARHSNLTTTFLINRPKDENLPYDKLGGLSVFLPDHASAAKLKANHHALDGKIAPQLGGWRKFVDKLID